MSRVLKAGGRGNPSLARYDSFSGLEGQDQLETIKTPYFSESLGSGGVGNINFI